MSPIVLVHAMLRWIYYQTRRFNKFSAVIFFVFAVHGLLLLNDGVFWDGWILYGLSLNHDYKSLLQIFYEAANPGFGYFHLIMWHSPLPMVASYKMLAFASLLVSTLVLYDIIRRLNVLSRYEGLFVTALFCCYPAFQVYIEISIIPYVVLCAVFFCGSHLLLFPRGRSNLSRNVWRIVAAFCFILSFQLASLIAFYLALFPLLIFLHQDALKNWTATHVYKVARNYIGFAALPFLFVSIKYSLLTPVGIYADYNRPRLDLRLFLNGIRTFIDNSITTQFSDSWALAAQYAPIFSLALLMSLGACYIAMNHLPAGPGPSNTLRKLHAKKISNLALATYSLFIFLLATIPYAIVGKPPSTSGWDTRHALLIALPVAIGLVAIGRELQRELRPKSRILKIFSFLLIAAFVTKTWNTYLDWEYRWIKDRSFIQLVSAAPRDMVDRSSYIYVLDHTEIGGQQYLFYDYTGMFKVALNSEAHIGNPAVELTNLPDLTKQIPLKRYLLSKFDARGCSAMAQTRFNPTNRSRISIIRKYYALLWLSQDQASAFLKGLTDVHWIDLTQKRLSDLRELRNAIDAYHAETGRYPSPLSYADSRNDGALRIGSLAADLVPKYLPEMPQDPRTTEKVGYVYLSDGDDFKLLALNPEDAPCVSQHHPRMTDPKRPDEAYGFWTEGAADW